MPYLTPDQICERYQIKKDKLYRMTCQRRIPFLKVGNELRFDPMAVDKIFVSRGQQVKGVLV